MIFVFSGSTINGVIVTPSRVTIGDAAIGSDVGHGASTPGIKLGSAYLLQVAPNTLAIRNGANPQTLRAYRTYTDDSNYERATFGWVGTQFRIGPEAAGTGIKRDILMTSNVRLTGRFIGYRQGVTIVHSGPDFLNLINAQSGAVIYSDDLNDPFMVNLPMDPEDGVNFTICNTGNNTSGPIIVNSGAWPTLLRDSITFGATLQTGASVTFTYLSIRGAWVVTGITGTVSDAGA